MAWSLKILGTNAAVPVHNRYPSAQALHTGTQINLIDCGEGTQSRLSEFGVKRSRINRIFISHLHGDHIFGLPGLLTSYNLFQRTQALHIYGPDGIDDFIDSVLRVTKTKLSFPLYIHPHSVKWKKILNTEDITVYSIPLVHRIPCTGYLFVEKVKPRKINKEAVAIHQVPVTAMKSLQEGCDWTRADGFSVKNEILTYPGRAPHSYAYCSDTAYQPGIVERIKQVEVLYHEATFGQELGAKAQMTGHSTASEAAMVARDAKVSLLVIGHFSSRYSDPDVLGAEARAIFPSTMVAREGLNILFKEVHQVIDKM